MGDVEFKELLKLAVEKLKDETVYQLLQADIVYQKDCRNESDAEDKYMRLPLTKEQKVVCDKLIECRGRQELEYSTHAYIAGLYDAFRIMAVLFPDKWDLKKVREALSI